MSESAEKDAPDPWDVHHAETGHSCGQVGDWFYCPTCGWESGARPIPPGKPRP